MSTTADVSVERVGQVVVAHLAGEVDMSNSVYVGDELRAAVPNDAHGMIVDLSEARYLDSAAIELLFDLTRRLARRRQKLRLVLPEDSPLKRVLLLTEIHTAAPVHDSLDSALAE